MHIYLLFKYKITIIYTLFYSLKSSDSAQLAKAYVRGFGLS